MSAEFFTSVASYGERGTDAARLLEYPYLRPQRSCITDGENLTPLPDSFRQFILASDEFLEARGLPLMAERIPVLAYGSNSNPVRLVEKMAAYGPLYLRSELQTVPMLEVEVPNCAVVWHGKLSMRGSVFADLHTGDDTAGRSETAFLQFFTAEQLGQMHPTEGTTYSFAPMQVLTKDGESVRAIGYLPNSSTLLQKDGQPIPVQWPNEERTSPEAMTASEAMEHIIATTSEVAEVKTPEELIQKNAELPLKPRQSWRAAIAERLAAVGCSAEYSFPLPEGWYYGRADFNGLNDVGHTPHLNGKPFVRLPEQVLARLRPPRDALDAHAEELMSTKGYDQEEARKWARLHLDPIAKIRNRAHDELALRLAEFDAQATPKTNSNPFADKA